ncbi:hypothetical protein DW177_05430 [Blautia sp. AM16-16B]|nr:hypothetical protein DW177_05430 [Blautia sp. AM16-16B]
MNNSPFVLCFDFTMIRIGIANLHNENHYTRLFPFSPYYAEIMLKMKKAYNPSYTAQTVGFKPLYSPW